MYRPISDYGLISNVSSVALISRGGSVDWACAPFIDSPSVFASILDDNSGGFWSISPEGSFKSKQEYIENSNVLVTTFETEGSSFKLIDFLPIKKRDEVDISALDIPSLKIHRKVVGLKGVSKIKITFCPRLNYARGETEITAKKGGVLVRNGNLEGFLSSERDFKVSDNVASLNFEFNEGESEYFVFRYNADKPKTSNDEDDHHDGELDEAVQYWRNWNKDSNLEAFKKHPKWQDMVERSSLILKALFFDPVGTVSAAPTTSLPETIGGIRNWDYRYNWLRDSSFIFQAFFKLNHVEEAKSYIKWLSEICNKKINENNLAGLQIMYGLRGEEKLDEVILSNLEGYKESKPVRIGNDAYRQKQWDIYGSILDLIWQINSLVGKNEMDVSMLNTVSPIANYVTKIWQEPDDGLWEVRSGNRHFTYSKMMCWVALDKAIKLQEIYGFSGEISLWKETRDLISKEIHEKAWNEKLNSFVQSYDSEDLDSSLLLMASTGFIDPKDPKMIGTINAIEEKLSVAKGLIKRYSSDDGLPDEEGAFLLSSFWLVDALVKIGERERAKEIFEIVLDKANHLGLFSEELDPQTGEFTGNFPQAYTHLGLVNSAFSLVEK